MTDGLMMFLANGKKFLQGILNVTARSKNRIWRDYE